MTFQLYTNFAPVAKEPEKPKKGISAKKQLEDYLFLRKQGYLIPQPLIDLVQEQTWKDEGVVQIWECSSKKCSETLEAFVRMKSVTCHEGHSMRVKWGQ